jgi:hypothetical protein
MHRIYHIRVAWSTNHGAAPESLFNRLKYVDTLRTHSLKGVSRKTTRTSAYCNIANKMPTNHRVLVMTMTVVCEGVAFPKGAQV